MDVRSTGIIYKKLACSSRVMELPNAVEISRDRAVCLRTSALSSLNMILKFLVDRSRQNSSIFGMPHRINIRVALLCC